MIEEKNKCKKENLTLFDFSDYKKKIKIITVLTIQKLTT